jgi:hypothetical protein
MIKTQFRVLSEQISDKFPSIHIKAMHVVLNVVQLTVLRKRRKRLGIQIIGVDNTSFSGSGDCKRPDARKHVAHGLAFLESVHQPFVFALQPRVPVNFREVERETAAVFFYRREHVVFSCQELHLKESVRFVDGVHFVHDGFDLRRVFVQNYFTLKPQS